MPYHTKDNTVDYKLSAEDYALYDNPFKTLTVDDFEATAEPNVFRLTDEIGRASCRERVSA